jgi:hypothetical protein
MNANERKLSLGPPEAAKLNSGALGMAAQAMPSKQFHLRSSAFIGGSNFILLPTAPTLREQP